MTLKRETFFVSVAQEKTGKNKRFRTQAHPFSSDFGRTSSISVGASKTAFRNFHQLNLLCFLLAFSQKVKSRKTFPGWGWTSYHKVVVLHIILSPAPSTVPSVPGTQSVFAEFFSNFSCLSQGNLCPQAAARRSEPRNNIYSKDPLRSDSWEAVPLPYSLASPLTRL